VPEVADVATKVPPKIVVRRDPTPRAAGDLWPWPWRIYCGECSRIRGRFEVGDAQTFDDVLDEVRRHAWFYHAVVL
jgi:hypothetical protein